jgi:hypothetical protein
MHIRYPGQHGKGQGIGAARLAFENKFVGLFLLTKNFRLTDGRLATLETTFPLGQAASQISPEKLHLLKESLNSESPSLSVKIDFYANSQEFDFEIAGSQISPLMGLQNRPDFNFEVPGSQLSPLIALQKVEPM